MRIFDPHIHMTSRTTDDYEAMAAAGIVAIVEPAFWLGQPRTTVGSFVDYFNSLVGWERFRASQFGIRHFCTMGLNPKESNNPRLADEVLALLPRYLDKDGVVAVGEIGFDDQTDAEHTVFARQVAPTATRSRAQFARSKSFGPPVFLKSASSSITTTRRHSPSSSRAGAGQAIRFTPTRKWTSTGWPPSSRSTAATGLS